MELRTVNYQANNLKPYSNARKEFEKSISLSNIIYLFYRDDECLYIGETWVSLVNRIYVNTPKEQDRSWYKEGNTIYIIELGDEIDDIARQTIESLFILAYRPKYNKKA